MAFLHKIWDETIAGPAPEFGSSKLHDFDPLNSRISGVVRTNRDLRNLRVRTSDHDSPLSSSPSSVSSPFTPGTPQGDQIQRLTWRKSSVDRVVSEPRTPTVYDWVVISALDR